MLYYHLRRFLPAKTKNKTTEMNQSLQGITLPNLKDWKEVYQVPC
jgi:hypothetical protein